MTWFILISWILQVLEHTFMEKMECYKNQKPGMLVFVYSLCNINMLVSRILRLTEMCTAFT